MPFWVIPGKTEGLSNFILGPGARTCLLTLQLAQLPPRFSYAPLEILPQPCKEAKIIFLWG